MELVLCTNCNAHASFRYQHTVVMYCSHCRTLISKNTEKYSSHQIAEMPDEPHFDIIGKSIWLNNESYTLTGVIRYYYTEGYLYKWSAYSHHRYVWLCESLGNWFIFKKVHTTESWNWPLFKPGYSVNYDGATYNVDALSPYYTFAIEGELPDFAYDKNKGISIECSNENAMIQFDVYENNTYELFQGFEVDINDLKIH